MPGIARTTLAVAVGAALVPIAGIPARAGAPPAGEVGTRVCRDLQLEVREALSEGTGRRGSDVRRAARIAMPRLVDGEVSGACVGCILREVAQRDAAKRCGPDRVCGDGQIDRGEDCDDGNSDDFDGCTSECRRARACGGIAAVAWCGPGEFCEFPPGTCVPAGGATDETGICTEIPDPCGCPRVLDPVCGCDGVTYSNDCHSGCAGTSVAHRGACACGRGTCLPGASCCNPVLGICTPPGGICALAKRTCEVRPAPRP